MELIRYYRFGGWRVGHVKKVGHKWISIRTIKAGDQYGNFKVLKLDTDSYKLPRN